jgi:predicted nucleic acid-binding protein
MSVINAAEVWYGVARLSSDSRADQAISEVKQLGIEFADVDWDLAYEAARYKAKHKMSLADCFAAALAKTRKAELVTGDKEFKQVEGQISVRWL